MHKHFTSSRPGRRCITLTPENLGWILMARKPARDHTCGLIPVARPDGAIHLAAGLV